MILKKFSTVTVFLCSLQLFGSAATKCPASLVPVHIVAFADTNGDGIRQQGESGIAGVRITNGRDVLVTSSDGVLDLEVDTAAYRFVTMTSPSGQIPTTPWYRNVSLPDDPADTVSFGLTPSNERAQTEFTWIHITDTQITSLMTYPLRDDIAEICSIQPRPLFIVNTGDIVNDGPNEAEWQYYADSIAESTIPLFHTVGNHDDTDNPVTLDLYEKYAGPPYYSFEIGNTHFIALDTWLIPRDVPLQQTWLANDLLQAPQEYTKIVFNHFMFRELASSIQTMLETNGISSVFSGHHHSTNLSISPAGIGDYSLIYTRAGGRDWTARAFNVVTSHADGSVTFNLRRLSVDHRAQLTFPCDSPHPCGAPLNVLVQAYDTAVPVAEIAASITDSTGSYVASLNMTLSGSSQWKAVTATAGWGPGEYSVAVSGSFADGAPIMDASTFSLVDSLYYVAAPTEDWPMFRHDSRGTAFTSRRLVPPFNLAWTAAMPGMIAHNSPIVSDGCVFMGSRNTEGWEAAGVSAFDARTGEKLWHRHLNGGVALAPLATGGVIVANALNDSVYGLTVETGIPVWSFVAERAMFNQAAPIGDDGQVIVGAKPYAYAVDPVSGSVHWTSDYVGPTWFEAAYSAAALTADRVVLNSYGDSGIAGGLNIFDRSTGTAVAPALIGAYRAPTIFGEHIFVVGGPSYLYQSLMALNLDGMTVWTSPADIRRGMGPTAYAHGIVVVSGRNGSVKAVDAETGTELWSKSVGPAMLDMVYSVIGGSQTLAAPAITEDIVHIGSIDGNLYSLDLYTGAEISRIFFGAPIASSAAIAGNMLFVGASDGNLYAFVGREEGVASVEKGPAGSLTDVKFLVANNLSGTGDLKFRWDLARSGQVKLAIYDLRGRLVRKLVDGELAGGPHEFNWLGTDDMGRQSPSGVYLVRFDTDSTHGTTKVTLVR